MLSGRAVMQSSRSRASLVSVGHATSDKAG